MANIDEYGYQKIREFVLANWAYLELQTTTGTPIKRFAISDGLIIAGTSAGATIEYKVVVNGTVTEFMDKTVGRSVIYSEAVAGTAITTEVLTNPFTFEQVDDVLTIIHKLEVPKVI